MNDHKNFHEYLCTDMRAQSIKVCGFKKSFVYVCTLIASVFIKGYSFQKSLIAKLNSNFNLYFN